MKLRIDKAVYGGAGIGRIADVPSSLAGKAVFVPHTLPGELVECEITEDRKSYANAKLLRVIEPSAERMQSGCEYFPTCGGCQYQHASYAMQLELKRSVLRETLERAGSSISEMDTLSSEPWQYRNRIRLHIRFGDFALCYREAGSHRDVPVDHCPIAAPVLQTAVKAFPAVAASCGIQTGLFDEIEFFANGEQSTVVLSLWTFNGASATRALPILCEALHDAMPMLAGALLFQTDTQKGQGRQQAAWGKPEMQYTVNDHSYRVGAGSFFQVNRLLLPELLARVTAGKAGKAAWDLFAGVGLFSVPLSQSFERVVAVESAASSVRDLRHNLQGPAHRVISSNTLDFLQQHVCQKNAKAPEFVIVDPPRAGLGKEVTTLLSQIGPQEITYVSCDPSTLARDLQSLLHSGYQLNKITLVDLFPETYHLETIADLVRT